MDEYISREAAVEKITFLCELREILCVPDDEFLRGLKNALNAVKSNEFIPSADVQPLSVVAEHIKKRLYQTAFNTTEEKARDAIVDMAKRIDIWIDELKVGDTNG